MVDLRIDRLVISLFRAIPNIRDYIYSSYAWEYSLRYYGLFDLWYKYDRPNLVRVTHIDNEEIKIPLKLIDSVTLFLKKVYDEDEGNFVSLLSHFLKNSNFIYTPLAKARFEEELNTLGYTIDNKLNIRPTTGSSEIDKKLRSELDEQLLKLDPEFPSIKQGAWETLLSNHKDKERQSITSMRELMDKVIDKLVPEKLDRKQKIKKILSSGSNSETELIDSVDEVVDKLYHFHSKGTHEKLTFKQAMYALMVTEYTLHYILTQKIDNAFVGS